MATLLGWLGFMGCVLAVVLGVQVAIGLPPVPARVVGGLGVTAGTLCLVVLLRQHVDRRSWSGIGLPPDRTAVPRLLFGIVLAAVVTAAAAAVTVWRGHAGWGWSADRTAELAQTGLPAVIITVVASTLLVQGFPEELVFRGYVFRNLAGSLPLWAVVAGSSLIFGSIHVFSNGGATTLGERALYAVMATGFGLTLAACRTTSGTLWLGVGFHSGFDALNGILITVHQDAYIPTQLITFGALVTGAVLTIAVRQWRAPLHWRGVPGDD